MDLNDPCLQVDAPCTVRLHVGGLGPSVISSDLVQIFSSLAKVVCVDVVNTKGRYFAYVTIQAASRDIKRLFSLYNGCMWKGGRLKLEKAKEFYLDKLHREWVDRDCLQSIQTPKLECLTTARSVTKSTDSSIFKIYIPKLRRVKAIPEKGLGKHKRSFERVEPLPYSLLQICNCDQHCPTTSEYQSGTRKEPLRMAEEKCIQGSKHTTIKASMNEISRECESFYKASGYAGRKAFEKKPAVYRKSGDGQGSNEVHALDEPVSDIKGGTAHSEKGDTECITNIDEPVLKMTGFNDFWPGNAKDSVEEETYAMGKFMDLSLQRGKANESKAFNRSWVQKASWKSLVGETGRMAFSLGSMLNANLDSNLESTRRELVQPSKLIDEPRTLKRSNSDHASSWVQDGGERILQTSECPKPYSTKSNELKQMMQEENLLSAKLGNRNDRGCTFMKSSTSEQDWLESKQAVKRIVKKSRKDGHQAKTLN